MKINIIYFFFLLLSFGCTNAEQSRSNILNQVVEQKYANQTNFELEFPVKPEIASEVIPVQGQLINITTKTAKVEDGIYLLFEIDLGGLTDQAKRDQNGFFNGMLSYLLGDLGVQYENLTDYKYKGYKGNNFNILSPNKDKMRTAKGKTLLVEHKAYIWFGVSKNLNSLEKVKKFIDSFKLK